MVLVVGDFLKGLIISMMISFGLIILFAFSLKWFSLNDGVIVPVNLAIKMLSVIIGAMIAVKGESKGLIKGLAFGIIYMSVAFISFSILANSFAFDLSFVLDLICRSFLKRVLNCLQ